MDPNAIISVGIGAASVGFAFGHRCGVAAATVLMKLKLHLQEMDHRLEKLTLLEKLALLEKRDAHDETSKR